MFMFKSNSKKDKQEKGQGLVEYALILVLVAIVVIAVLMLLGPIIGNVFSTINAELPGGASCAELIKQSCDSGADSVSCNGELVNCPPK